MKHVTASANYRVVIPKEVRDLLGIRPGQKVEVFWDGSSLRLALPDSPEGSRDAGAAGCAAPRHSARRGRPAAPGHPGTEALVPHGR